MACMDRLRILVLGAGAIGLYYGGRLQQAGHDVVFQARGANLLGLRERGLHARSIDGDFSLYSVDVVGDSVEAAESGPYDLVLITLKSYQTTPELLSPLSGALATGGLVVTLQNGVESTVPLRGSFLPSAVIPGIAFIGARRIGAGRVSHAAAGRIVVGEEGAGCSRRVTRLADMFRAAGIAAEASEDMRLEQWRKLVWNAPFNGMTALTGVYAHELLTDPSTRETVRAAMEEVVAVGRGLGIALADSDVEATLAFTREAGPVRTSMLVDRELGRPLEVEALYGPPVREGQRLGIPTPILSTLQALLRVVDASVRASSHASAS